MSLSIRADICSIRPVREIDRLIEQYGVQAVLDVATPFLAEGRIERLEERLASKLGSLTVVLENLYDPHNGSAAVRSCEAFNLADIHVVEGETGSFRAAAEVAMGAQKWIDVHMHSNPRACAESLRAQGFTLCATVPGADIELEDMDVSKPIALWFGNERDGLSGEAQELCDHKVSIEMLGFVQSFNLSVSVAIFVHRLAQKRRQELGRLGDLSEERLAHMRARWRGQGIRGLRQILEREIGE